MISGRIRPSRGLRGTGASGSGEYFPVHQDLREERAGVVIGGHDEPVGPGTEQGDAVAGGEGRSLRSWAKKSPLSQTGPTTSIGAVGAWTPPAEQFRASLVECRADEVVHRGIDDGERLGRRRLDILHGREEDARIADEEATGLEEVRSPSGASAGTIAAA